MSVNNIVIKDSFIATPTTTLLNTWYHVVCIFQMFGPCSMYLNGQLVGTTYHGMAPPSGTRFCIGALDSLGSPQQAFNGYIDEVRIYHSAIPTSFIPRLSMVAKVSSINLTFDNSLVDSKFNASLSSVGSIAYVSGASGGYAANFINTSGSTANNYIRGSCSLPNSFSMTMKFKMTTLLVYPDRVNSRLLELNSATANSIFYVDYIDIEGSEYDGFYIG